jgi:hypothetical protein
MSADELRALAARVMALDGPCRETDCAVWETIDPANALSHRAHFNDGGNGAKFQCTSWEAYRLLIAPAFTASLDAAMSLGRDYLLVAMSDIAADGMPGVCLCSDTSSSPPKEHWGIPSCAPGEPLWQVMARAYTAATLRALAADMDAAP